MKGTESDQPVPFMANAIAAAGFSDQRRHVTRIFRSEECEVMVVGWEKGQSSSLHRHDRSMSAVIVLAGTVAATNGPDTRPSLGVGSVLITPAGMHHQLANASTSRAVTLHVYTPPLDEEMPPPFVDATG